MPAMDRVESIKGHAYHSWGKRGDWAKSNLDYQKAMSRKNGGGRRVAVNKKPKVQGKDCKREDGG